MSLLIRLGQFAEELRSSWCFDEKLHRENLELQVKNIDLELRAVKLEKENVEFKLRFLGILDSIEVDLKALSERVEEVDAWMRNNKKLDPPHIGSHV